MSNLKDLRDIYLEPFDEYKSRRDFISPSDIKGCETPKQYLYKRNNPRNGDTTPTLIGSYFHATILEPDKIESEFAIWKNNMKPFPDKNYQNTQNKTERDSFIARETLNGKKVLTEDMFETVNGMYNSIEKSDVFLKIFNRDNCICEYSFLACAKILIGADECGDNTVFTLKDVDGSGENVAYGIEILPISEAKNIPIDRLILLKCRPDAVSKVAFYIADVKSTWLASPKPHKFKKQSFEMEYHIQSAMYLDIVSVATGKQFDDFFFGVCENKPPYDNAIYICSQSFIDYGKKVYKTRLIKIKLAENSGNYQSFEIYSGLSSGVLMLDIPTYATSSENVVF